MLALFVHSCIWNLGCLILGKYIFFWAFNCFIHVFPWLSVCLSYWLLIELFNCFPLPSVIFLCFSWVLFYFLSFSRRSARERRKPILWLVPLLCLQVAKPDTFINAEAQEQYKKLEKRAFHYERKLNLPEKYADQILNRLNFYHWEFVKFDPVEVNEH